jgi:hypothetical protein
MTDPLAEVVTLLQPRARFSKLVLGTSPWRISRSDSGQPFFCVILEGGCRIAIDGHEPMELLSEDFALGFAAPAVRACPRRTPAGHPRTTRAAAGGAVHRGPAIYGRNECLAGSFARAR